MSNLPDDVAEGEEGEDIAPVQQGRVHPAVHTLYSSAGQYTEPCLQMYLSHCNIILKCISHTVSLHKNESIILNTCLQNDQSHCKLVSN